MYLRVADMSRHEAQTGARTSLTWDTAFEALSSDRRRRLLAILDAEGEITVSGAVRRLAEEEADGEPQRVDRETVEVSLHHVHLPALRTAGLVEWDREAGTVSLVPGVDRLPLFASPTEPAVARRGAVTPERCFDVE